MDNVDHARAPRPATALPAPARRSSLLLRTIFLALLVAAVFVAYRLATAPGMTSIPPEMTPQITPQTPSRGAGSGTRTFTAHRSPWDARSTA